jgi:MarR family transcriptional regulator, 2-MHQ and catechol-resistance regulon repressor
VVIALGSEGGLASVGRAIPLEPASPLSADSRDRMADAAPKNSGIHLWLVLMKAHRALSRHAMRSIEPSGLGFSDFAVLEVLLNKGPQRVNDIGRRIDLTSGSITTAIDRLEKRGLAVRGLDGEDRRSRIVRLTPAGRARIGEVFADHAAALEAASAGLTKAERKSLIALLKKLGIAAERTA